MGQLCFKTLHRELFFLWKVTVKNYFLFLGLLVLAITAGLIIYKAMPAPYQHSLVLKTARHSNGSPLQDDQSVKNILEQAIIPQMTSAYAADSSKSKIIKDLKVQILGSGYLKLTIASDASLEEVATVLGMVLGKLHWYQQDQIQNDKDYLQKEIALNKSYKADIQKLLNRKATSGNVNLESANRESSLFLDKQYFRSIQEHGNQLSENLTRLQVSKYIVSWKTDVSQEKEALCWIIILALLLSLAAVVVKEKRSS